MISLRTVGQGQGRSKIFLFVLTAPTDSLFVSIETSRKIKPRIGRDVQDGPMKWTEQWTNGQTIL